MAYRQASMADTLILNVKPTGVGRPNKSLKFVQDYLVRFGYLEGKFRSGVLDRKTATAIKQYQALHGIRPTGAFNVVTRRLMAQPRCGMPDILHSRSESILDSVASHAAGVDPNCFRTVCGWGRREVTFAFDNGTADVATNQEFGAVRNAFLTWEGIAPLTFREVALGADPDVVIDWRNAADPDRSMVGSVVAHADFPPGCSVVVADLPLPLHFDDSETLWTIGTGAGQLDVETIALHELGHILGLGHSFETANVMHASVSPNSTNRIPTDCDIDGIVALYAVLEIWRGSWTGNWSHFVPFVLSGQPHMLSYKIGTGEVDFDRLMAGGSQLLWERTWTRGWSHFVPFALNGQPHMLSYKQGTGEVDIDRVTLNGTQTLWEGDWTGDWSHFVPFVPERPASHAVLQNRDRRGGL